MRRSSSAAIVKSPGASFGAVIASALTRRKSDVGQPQQQQQQQQQQEEQQPSAAKKRWGALRDEIMPMMTWKDLLKKRVDNRAAKAIKAGELTKIQKVMAVKDWADDATTVNVEVFVGGPPGGGSRPAGPGELMESSSMLRQEESRLLKKKRMNSDIFKESMFDVARHYAKSGSSTDFVRLLQQLLRIIFYDIDVEAARKKTQREFGKRPAVSTEKIRTVVMVPPRQRVDPMAWTQRRVWDLKKVRNQGRKKLWESSCRLPNDFNYKVTKEKQDWYDGGGRGKEENQLERLEQTRLAQKEWVVSFGGTVSTSISKYAVISGSFSSTW
mgnify:CR=1 FL=1